MSRVWDSIADWFHKQTPPPSLSELSDMEEEFEDPGRYRGESRDSGLDPSLRTSVLRDREIDARENPVDLTDNLNAIESEGEGSDFDDDVIDTGNLDESLRGAVGGDNLLDHRSTAAATLFPVTGGLDSTHGEEDMGPGARPRTKPVPVPPRPSPQSSDEHNLEEYRERISRNDVAVQYALLDSALEERRRLQDLEATPPRDDPEWPIHAAPGETSRRGTEAEVTRSGSQAHGRQDGYTREEVKRPRVADATYDLGADGSTRRREGRRAQREVRLGRQPLAESSRATLEEDLENLLLEVRDRYRTPSPRPSRVRPGLFKPSRAGTSREDNYVPRTAGQGMSKYDLLPQTTSHHRSRMEERWGGSQADRVRDPSRRSPDRPSNSEPGRTRETSGRTRRGEETGRKPRLQINPVHRDTPRPKMSRSPPVSPDAYDSSGSRYTSPWPEDDEETLYSKNVTFADSYPQSTSRDTTVLNSTNATYGSEEGPMADCPSEDPWQRDDMRDSPGSSMRGGRQRGPKTRPYHSYAGRGRSPARSPQPTGRRWSSCCDAPKQRDAGKFDGKNATGIPEYFLQFETIAEYNHWSYDVMGIQLVMSLVGDAREVLSNIPRHLLHDYESVKKAIYDKYAPPGREAKFNVDLWNRSCQENETASQYATALKKLSKEAFPTGMAEEILVGFYIGGLRSAALKRAVRLSHPQTLQEAANTAMLYEAYDEKATSPMPVKKPKVIGVVQEANTTDIFKDGILQLGEMMKNQNADLAKTVAEAVTSRPSASRPTGRYACWQCQSPDHHKGDCPELTPEERQAFRKDRAERAARRAARDPQASATAPALN